MNPSRSPDPRSRGSVLVKIISTCLALGLAAHGIQQLKEAASDSGPADRTDRSVLRVRTRLLESEPVEDRQRVHGFLRPVEEIRLSSEVSARVEERLHDEGDLVEVGATLFRLDASGLGHQVRALEAGSRGFQAQLAYSRSELERSRTLVKRESVRATELEQLQAEVDRLEAALAGNEARLAEVRRQIGRCEVKAPVAGRLFRKLKEPGEYVQMGEPLAILRMVDPLELEVEVQAHWRLALDPGLEVTGRVEDVDPVMHRQPREFQATLVRTPAGHREETRRFPLEFRISNPDGHLFPGLYASVELVLETGREIITVPREAVIRRFGQDWVRVVLPLNEGTGDTEAAGERGTARGRLEDREVRLAPLARRPASWRVVEGLEAGERILIYPLDKALAGQEVEFDLAAAASGDVDVEDSADDGGE